MTGYQMNFNQDFTSISVLNKTGFHLFSVNSNDKVDEIFNKDNESIRIVERLFNSSLVVLVTVQKPNSLKMVHFKKKQDICNCVYPVDILSVRMNRSRLVVCLATSIHIHDIRDMKILRSIEPIEYNLLGLCSLSLNSLLAFPISASVGTFRIYNAHKLQPGIVVRAHESPLSALSFTPNGQLIATTSERGTVVRVFCVKNGERLQEFRRGLKRCVRISSLVFSVNGDFLCVSSNTETVHIFKIDTKAVENVEAIDHKTNAITANTTTATTAITNASAEPKCNAPASNQRDDCSANDRNANCTVAAPPTGDSGGWTDYLSKAVYSYLIPSQVCDVLAQDRAFATATLPQAGLQHVCGLAVVKKELKLLIACEDGFLYIHDFDKELGGQCKLTRVHDLRYALEGVTELNFTESMEKLPPLAAPNPTANSKNATPTSPVAPKSASKSASSVLIEVPDPVPDNSYAGILKGDQTEHNLTESGQFRKLIDAINTPNELYDECQFPPVSILSKD